MKEWSVGEAESRFGELLSECLEHGPQLVMRQGLEAAVLVPAGEWRRLRPASARTLKELLLSDEARFDFDLEHRQPLHRRPPPEFG